jgi:SAM-dependent methyltransferase
MARLVARYLDPEVHHRVVDIGSRSSGKQTTTHRDLFAGRPYTFIGVDIAEGRNVDRVMTKPYRLPVRSGSVDVVISGQAFEHIPFPWASMLEIARVLKPDGLVLLTAPSRGHVHTAVDCWRYYPDGMKALAAFAGLTVLEVSTDFPPTAGKRRHDYKAIDTTYRYWGDTVAVFQKPADYPRRLALVRRVVVSWGNRAGPVGEKPTIQQWAARLPRRAARSLGDRLRA